MYIKFWLTMSPKSLKKEDRSASRETTVSPNHEIKFLFTVTAVHQLVTKKLLPSVIL